MLTKHLTRPFRSRAQPDEVPSPSSSGEASSATTSELVDDLRRQLQQLTRRVDELTVERDLLHGRCDELARADDERVREHERLARQRDKLSARVDELFRQNNAAARRGDRLTSQRDQLALKLARLQELSEVGQHLDADRPARAGVPSFADLSLPIPPERASFLDREDLDESRLDDDQRAYRADGFLIKEGFLPEELTAPYLSDRLEITDPEFSVWGGSYMGLDSMKELCLYRPLTELVERLIGKPAALFLTLSGLQSTQRTWHQDFYLKPGYENVDYCAVWMAVGDVDPDSGPYQYIPGSHRLPSLRRELIYEWLTPEARQSAGNFRVAEAFVTGACERLIQEEGLEVRSFVPKRGDILIWHHSLLHQGSRQRRHDLIRPGLVAHYNSAERLEGSNKGVRVDANGSRWVERHDREDIVSKRRSAQPLVTATRDFTWTRYEVTEGDKIG